MDAMQRDVARSAPVTDAMGDTGLALRKPGFRVSDAFQRVLTIYDAYDEAVVCGRITLRPAPVLLVLAVSARVIGSASLIGRTRTP